jgi:hypothetical protein
VLEERIDGPPGHESALGTGTYFLIAWEMDTDIDCAIAMRGGGMRGGHVRNVRVRRPPGLKGQQRGGLQGQQAGQHQTQQLCPRWAMTLQ